MSWLSKLWSNIRWDYVFKKIEQVLVALAGTVGKSLASIALQEVRKAEASGLKGPEKLRMALESLKNNPQFRHLPENVLKAAIEATLTLVDPKGNEYGVYETR